MVPKSNKRAAYGQVSQNKSSGPGGMPNPPQWTSTVRFNYIQRFVINDDGVSELEITNTNLLDLKCVAKTTTSASRIFNAVKLNSIDVWSANQGIAANTIEVEWYTNNPYMGSNSKLSSDTSIGISNIAHVHVSPPANSFSGSWVPNVIGASYTMFKLTAPIGTVLDLNLTVELIDTEDSISVTGSVSSASPGALYTRHLDNTPTVSPSLIAPLGVNII